ncbi:MAG: aldose 1-epimerase [Huintestinicola sp.]
MELFARKTNHKGIEAVELAAHGYYAVVAPTLGSNILRFRDNTRDIEVFRYSDGTSISEIMNAPEIWGLPTLYLPNRLDKGLLRTSDGLYRFPVNEERFGNHLHGFIHKRAYKVKEMGTEDGKAYVENELTFDENDFFYNCFPLKFKVRIRVELSERGLTHTVTMTNLSKKMLPLSFATHTTINAPFVSGGQQENITLQVPACEHILFNKKRWLPNGKRSKLSDYDKQYLEGTMCPVLKDICNDMYSGGTVKLDGKDFRGTVMTDTATGKKICNEVDEKYRFWIVWNHNGFMNYFCPEPMTAQVNAPNLDMPAEESGYEELAPKESYTLTQRFFTMG